MWRASLIAALQQLTVYGKGCGSHGNAGNQSWLADLTIDMSQLTALMSHFMHGKAKEDIYIIARIERSHET